ncbi:MAG: M4 family metallopeptidase, partial [Bacteroidota bacterium]
YYFNVFGRNSINNAGYALTSYVNESATVDNAYWDGTAMHFGNRSSNGAGITAIDVTGHELTHGLTQYTSNLTYSNQSGAMNESMSDIFGKTVQFWSKPNDVNWLLSNDMGWNIRDMANPNAYGQPDTYLGTNWYTGTADNGGVHTNSGVGNFMYYLLVTGGSGVNDIGNSYVVQGIGLTDAAAILYRSETVYLISSSNYSAWRTACISAATDLFGASSNQANQVMNAWYAVGIGTAAPSGTCSIPSGLSSSAIGDNVATISWAAATGASSYQVQYKASSSTNWTTAAASGTTLNLTNLLPGTTYTYQVLSFCTSGGFTAYSTAATFTTTGVAPLIYCTSAGQTLDGIANVTFNTINNTTGLSGYADYTATISTTVSTGSVYPLTVKLNTGGNYTNYAKAWIDWNHDGTFSTTSEEYTLGTAVNVTSGNTSLSPLSITVPASAYIGSTRMRVSTQYNANPAPCTASFDGEVEDYTINVIVGSNCATPSTLTSTSIGTAGATLGWASTGAASYTLQWRLTSGTTWTTVSGITTN